MKASTLEFRLRYVLHLIIFVLGFWAPWNLVVPIDPRGPNAHVWGILAANLAQIGVGSLLTAFNVLLVLGILFAVAGASLRTWGAAYLGSGVVHSGAMHSAPAAMEGVLTDGPFGHLRNPLYVGTFLHTLALSLLMPRSGAIFCIVAVGILQIRLILGEEAYLLKKLGQPYAAYCALVPRIIPSLRARVTPSGHATHWLQAFLGEIYFWGVAGAYAVLGWRYNAALLTQAIIVAVGASLVARALVPKLPTPTNA
jgi:protein-S-isoprenylcysteine O-methyltransferase Ste14